MITAQMFWARAVVAGDMVGPDAPAREFYRMLEAYYLNNGLYDSTQQMLYENGIWTPGMKALRNPAKRTVEFHVTHIWPGSLDKALQVVTLNDRIRAPIKQVWKWSNWGVKKQLAARWFALFGDWFCKVATSTDASGKVNRVFLQNIKPELVTDFEEDERGNVISIRLDIPYQPPKDGFTLPSARTYTEIWTREEYRLYIHVREPGAPVSTLGDPVRVTALSEFGIDFVPFVHSSFMDLGDKRGTGVFTLALDKIDEANRMTTRLHQMIFRYNKPTVAILANGTDAAGRPLPPPKVAGSVNDLANEKDEDVKSFPGTSKMEYLVPPLNYAAHLDIINAQMRELEEDLPELSYYRQKELGSSISGKAVRLLLSQAVDRTLEARGNLELGLVRADKMALTMGVNAGIFKRIGIYERGDFEHEFAEREVIPFTVQESADTLATEVTAGVPLALAAKRRGWNQSDIEELRITTENKTAEAVK
ncbi:MAG TPA: hypothetical protein VGK00_02895 [Anaerolineales bacterium]|jgi:hypothetical protein